MKTIKLLTILLSLTIFLNSCGGLREAGKVLRNDKTNSTDEFLIKKQNPLIQPPDFEIMPEPGTAGNTANKNKNNIKKMLRSSDTQSRTAQSKSSSTEQSILNQIKK